MVQKIFIEPLVQQQQTKCDKKLFLNKCFNLLVCMLILNEQAVILWLVERQLDIIMANSSWCFCPPCDVGVDSLLTNVHLTPSVLSSYLSTHSLTTAKFPSPITLPTMYLSKMLEAAGFPLTEKWRQISV